MPDLMDADPKDLEALTDDELVAFKERVHSHGMYFEAKNVWDQNDRSCLDGLRVSTSRIHDEMKKRGIK